MSKNEETYNKQDLFQSGKAYPNSIFDQGEGSLPNTNYPYNGYPQGENFLVPSQPPAQNPSFLGNLPVKDIKNFVDRMGGIDGIRSMVNKMNSMFKSLQRMTPMIKLLMTSFSKAKTTDLEGHNYSRRRRRRRRRRKTSSKSKYNNSRPNSNQKSRTNKK
jgi:hypothetical protein